MDKRYRWILWVLAGVGLALLGPALPLVVRAAPGAEATAAGKPLATGTAAPSPTSCALYFTDVPGSQPFYGPILCLACQGVLSGYEDATFRPNAGITRGQVAKLVANSAGFSDVIPAQQQTFADVAPASPFW